MITLSADNRSLLLGAPYTALRDNNSSGQSSLVVLNSSDVLTGAFVLIGLFGNPTSEMFQVGTVDNSTQSIQLLDVNGANAQTLFSHTESTRVTVLPFNQVRFFWTAATGTIADETPTFDTNNPLSSWFNVDPSAWFTTYDDGTHTTGFGWFLFQNSVSQEASQPSNAIPYSGFATNSVQFIFNDFLSLLNNKELRLVTNQDMFSWLNEGNALIRNKLNLSNPEYTASDVQTLNFISGASEYLLPADFGDLVQIVDNTTRKTPIDWISIKDAMAYLQHVLKYYIRGRYIGFVPTPDVLSINSVSAVFYRYRSKGGRFTGLDDLVDLPDNGAFVMKDWMMYRACLKFQNPNAQIYYKAFNDGLNQMIVSSFHRDANLDSWGIAPWANA
jgi:hypothetical protein